MEAYLLWYMFAGVLLVLEAFSPGMFLFVCFALAALISGLATQLAAMAGSALSIQGQLGFFLVGSIGFLFFVKPLLKAVIKIPTGEESFYANKLIDKQAIVFKAISPTEMGAVRLLDSDETWLAKADKDIAAGSQVRILAVEANHLIVTAL